MHERHDKNDMRKRLKTITKLLSKIVAKDLRKNQ